MRKKKSITMFGLGHPGKIESMLSDMARKGWMLDDIKMYTYYFTRANPEEMEYRLLYTEDGIRPEQMTRFEEMGWKLVAWVRNIRVLGARTYDLPSERYFAEQEEQDWKRAGQKKLWLKIIVGVLALCLAAMNLVQLHGGFHLNWRVLMEQGDIKVVAAMIGILCLYSAMLVLRVKTYIKDIKEQGKMAHHKKWKTKRYITRTVVIIYFVLNLIVPEILSIANRNNNRVKELKGIPIIDLDEVFPVKASEQLDDFQEKIMFLDIERYTYEVQSQLQDTCYMQEEYYVRNTTLDENGFTCSVLHNIGKENEATFAYTKTRMLKEKGLDTVYYVPEESSKEGGGYAIAAAKGKDVFCIHVHGTEDYEPVLHLIAQRMA